MSQTTNVQPFAMRNDAREQIKLQLAQYLEEQPESTQVFHKWMKRLDVASMGVIAAAFIVALYVSITWKSVDAKIIPMAWFFFAASPLLTLVLVGLHAIILRAFPPIVLPGKMQKFVTHNAAVWTGLGTIVLGLVTGAFWVFFAYAVWTTNWIILVPLINIIAVVVSIVMVVSILYKMVTKISKVH